MFGKRDSELKSFQEKKPTRHIVLALSEEVFNKKHVRRVCCGQDLVKVVVAQNLFTHEGFFFQKSI